MKVIYTEPALDDLDQILSFLSVEYPSLVSTVERRIRAVVARLARHPESAQAVKGHRGVRMVPLIRYPYRIFYRVTDAIEILHIHHTAREPWGGEGEARK